MTPLTAESLKVGDELPELGIQAINRTTLALFAGASGDHNPMHIDLDVARSAGEPDVFAHGMLSMAYLARYVTDMFPQNTIRSFGVRFTSITPLFAEPVCRGRITALTPDSITLAVSVSLADSTSTLLGEAVIDRMPLPTTHNS